MFTIALNTYHTNRKIYVKKIETEYMYYKTINVGND